LCSICMSHGEPGAPDGRIDIGRLLAKDKQRPLDIAHLMVGDVYLGEALTVSTTIDLSPEFPTLIEAGNVDMNTFTFTPSHRAHRLVRFRFDRSYPAWVRRAQGK